MISEIINTINEGKGFSDKLVLFLHYLEAPFTRNKTLLRNVTIRNNDGTYFCKNNIFSVACSTKSEKINMYIDSLDNTGTIDKQFVKGEKISGVWKSTKSISVATDTLDNIVKKSRIAKIDLIKIDTEGIEHWVLQGAKEIITKHHPKIIFESMNEQCLEQIRDLLFNYKIKKINKELFIAFYGDKK